MERLCILSCGDFYPDVAAAVAAEGWTDVAVSAFPPDCAKPPLTWEQVRERVPAGCTRLVLVGHACLRALAPPPPDLPPSEIVTVDECFDLVAPMPLVREKMASGAYLMTRSWLQGWENRMRAQGFDRSLAGDFFRDFAQELVLLDTHSDTGGEGQLAAMADAVGVPGKRIPIGIDVMRDRLRKLVGRDAGASTGNADKDRLQRDADQTAMFDMMARLAAARQESDVITETCGIFSMLFAPRALYYFPADRGEVTMPVETPEAVRADVQQLTEAYAWTASGRGFLLRVSRGEQVLGVIYADGLAFAEYKERYLTMALALASVCALALEGARTRRVLVEAEKMASLSVLIAGVAHEVNTPVGVCLATASTFESQLRVLREKFAGRTMKHSDLSRFLDLASDESHLIVTNLERMGSVIESFRKVAVERVRPVKKQFVLRELIEQTCIAAGCLAHGDAITLAIDCDPTLVIESYAGDWISIFTNLSTNALKHAFKGRDRGRIEIRARVEGANLAVDFSDDGVGLSTEGGRRIFDPFYTTDMQHGMGLGMHLVYNLVRQSLGGTIACESKPGAGARFHIVVPLTKEARS